jgi:hypothetical protein
VPARKVHISHEWASQKIGQIPQINKQKLCKNYEMIDSVMQCSI